MIQDRPQRRDDADDRQEYDPDDQEEEAEWDWTDSCGMMPNGQCTMTGSEDCDLCPWWFPE